MHPISNLNAQAIEAFVQRSGSAILRVAKDKKGQEYLQIYNKNIFTWIARNILKIQSFRLETVTGFIGQHQAELNQLANSETFYQLINAKIKHYQEHFPKKKIQAVANSHFAHSSQAKEPTPLIQPSPKQRSSEVKALQEKMTQFKTALEKNPDQLTFDLLEEIKACKDRAKQLLSGKPNIPRQERSTLEKVIKNYNEIKQGYEILMDLSHLKKEIKDRLAQGENPLHLNIHMLKIGLKFDKLIQFTQLRATEIVKQKDKESWKKLRKIIFEASVEAKEIIKQKKPFRWVTGSKASSLLGIARVAQTNIANYKPALVPTGLLLEHQIVPLSGEITWGIGKFGVNQDNLSGKDPLGLDVCFNYASGNTYIFNAEFERQAIEEFKFPAMDLRNYHSYFTAIERLKIAILRLKLMGLYTKEIDQQVQRIKDEIVPYIQEAKKDNDSWKQYAPLICQDITNQSQFNTGTHEAQFYQAGQLVGVNVYTYDEFEAFWGKKKVKTIEHKIGVITDIAGDQVQVRCDKHPKSRVITSTKELFSLSKIALDEELKKNSLSNNEIQKSIQSLEPLLDSFPEWSLKTLNNLSDVEPWQLTEKEKAILQDPYPIVWGSFNLKSEPFQSGAGWENLVKGPAVIGEDIQIAFTSQERVKDLQSFLDEMLAPYHAKVTVMSFEAGFYLARNNPIFFIGDFNG